MTSGATTRRGVSTIFGIAAGASLLLLAACSGTTSSGGGPANADASGEVRSSSGLYKVGKPYKIKGVWYYPQIDYEYVEEGVASWYGPGFHGKATANGEVYDQNDMTAAHRTLPLPSIVRVTNLENGRSIKVRVNDRGPFAQNRIIDMSRRGAQLLGFYGSGTTRVRVEIDAEESRQLALAMTGSEYPGGAMVASRQPAAPIDTDAQPVPMVAASSIEPTPAAAPVYEAPPAAMPMEPVVIATAAPIDVGQASMAYEPPPQWSPPATDYAASPAYSPMEGSAATAAHDSGSVAYAAAPSPPVSSSPLPDETAAAHQDTPHHRSASSATEPTHPHPVSPPYAVGEGGGRSAYVQAGAFANPENANRVRQTLSRFGPVAVDNPSTGGQRLYRVRLGPIASASEASRLLAAVIKAGYPGSQLVVE